MDLLKDHEIYIGTYEMDGANYGVKLLDHPSDVSGDAIGPELFKLSLPGVAGAAIPGDFDGNNDIDFNDSLSLLNTLFFGDASTGCGVEAATLVFSDHNGDGFIDMSDAVSQLRNEFLGGPPHAGGEGCAGCGTGSD